MLYVDLTAYVVNSEGISAKPGYVLMAKATANDKGKGPLKPKAPPEQFITIDKREPTQQELELILDAAAKGGFRPGVMGTLINHESDGTWNPHVRPAAKGKPAPKVTTTGEVRGETSSSGVGIGQYVDRRWLLTMYAFGEDVIKHAGLDKLAPDKVKLIREVRGSVDKYFSSKKLQKPGWEDFGTYLDVYGKTDEVKKLLHLRSDAPPQSSVSGPTPFYALGSDISDYIRQIEALGLKPDPTNIYILHHTNLQTLRELTRNPDAIPKASDKAVAGNGGVFVKKDEEGNEVRKTGAETYAFYRAIINEGHVSAFEKRYFGREFTPTADNNRLRYVQDTKGNPAKVRSDLIIERMSNADFIRIWKEQHGKPAPELKDPASFAQALQALQQIGDNFGRQLPKDADDKRFKLMIGSFKQQAGLPFPDSGLDANTLKSLQQAAIKATYFAEIQHRQLELSKEPSAVSLRDLAKATAGMRRGDPAREPYDNYVRALKEDLATQGYLARPPKGRDFDGQVDARLLNSLSEFQQAHGLADTKGVVDLVTAGTLKKVDAIKLKSEAAPAQRVSAAGPADDFNFMAPPLSVSLAALEPAEQPTTAPSAARVRPSSKGPQYS